MNSPNPKNYPTLNNKRLHVLKAEAALGKPLPNGAVVHHADGTKSANSPLVICENNGYHQLLHARTRIVRAGGDPNTQRICGRCKSVKDLGEFAATPCRTTGFSGICRPCDKIKARLARKNRRDVINARRRSSYENRREAMNAQRRSRYENNREAINAQRRVLYRTRATVMGHDSSEG